MAIAGVTADSASRLIGSAASGARMPAPAESPPPEDAREDTDTSAPKQDEASGLSPAQFAQIAKLRSRDRQVRAHEQAHLSASGGLALSGATYSYQRGPDGLNYAIGGEVRIDTSAGHTPQDTLRRARLIQAAALAPADPSGADRAIAAYAMQMAQKAQLEIALAAREEAAQTVEQAARARLSVYA